MCLETLKTKQIHNFFENPRGRITDPRILDIKANNRYCPDYDPTKPSTFIFDIDATNLYGHSMIQDLPHNEFRFEMSKTEYDHYSKELISSIKEEDVDKFQSIINKTIVLNNYNFEGLKKVLHRNSKSKNTKHRNKNS